MEISSASSEVVVPSDKVQSATLCDYTRQVEDIIELEGGGLVMVSGEMGRYKGMIPAVSGRVWA